ncbi:MAG: hypothetical protein IPM25_02560 [Chloracidobacterium sp.]|nr:hypothetical protein [Chloracidobacterium sp.]
MQDLSAVIVSLAGMWSIALVAFSIAGSKWADRIHRGFASSAFTHSLEMFVRIIVRTACVI